MRALSKYEKNISSFLGEDGVLAECFRRLKIYSGFFIDIGAMDGLFFSNTWPLMISGWSGLAIEADPISFGRLAMRCKGTAVHALNARVEPESVVPLLLDSGVNREPEFVNIDVDGLDWEIFESLKEISPKVICIEISPISTTIFRRGGRQYFIEACDRLLQAGYVSVWTNVNNVIAVRADLARQIGAPDPGYLWRGRLSLHSILGRIRIRLWHTRVVKSLWVLFRHFRLVRYARRHGLQPLQFVRVNSEPCNGLLKVIVPDVVQ